MKWWRSILLVGSLLFIATATLTPGQSNGVAVLRPDFWCLACGTEGGADVTLNIALFIPLGVALALLRVSPPRAFVVGALLSLAIEAAQRAGFPVGRVASISDLLTNAYGTLIGALVAWHHRRWLQPSPRAASVLSVASLLAVATFLGFTGWALGRDPVQPTDVGQTGLVHSKGAFAAGYGWYHGQVTRALINGKEFRQTGTGPVILSGSTDNTLRGEVEVVGRDERRELVPFLSVRGADPQVPDMILGQANGGALLRVRLRGSHWRLPGPSLVLPNAFVAAGASRRTLQFVVTPEQWTLSSTMGTESLNAGLPISLSLGWTLFQTVVQTGDRLARVVSVLWLFVLWLPVGYWCAIAKPFANTSNQERETGSIQRWQFVAAGVVALLLTLGVVPRAMGIAATLPQEWMLSVAGLAVGVFLATRFYHYIPSQ